MRDIYKYSLLLVVIIISFFFVSTSYASFYNFQDEFNQERTANNVDSSKWTVYPNSSNTTIMETGGYLTLTAINNKSFPYITSKYNPFPISNDFTLEFGIQYTSVTQSGTGVVISLVSPSNGTSEMDKDKPEVYFFGVWQGNDEGFNITYNGYCAVGISCTQPGTNIVHIPPPHLSYHKIKLGYVKSKYEVYLDGNKIFTSPITTTIPTTIWIGNPTHQTVNATWTSFKVDYIRVSANPQPFLDLPWDYLGKGLSFDDATLSINSYFDHQYPLLSYGLILSEPPEAASSLIPFFENLKTHLYYSKHDGYDFGKPAKVNLGDPVLAAASGWAAYVNNCSSCGNMIVIDHQNGYQTRYMHLQKEGLITAVPNQPVWVNNRDQIGKVGVTGNTTGAHIHFGIFQDKDGDGNFENNIPDGVTDPYGWQSSDPDPWENYNFKLGGVQKSGNKSYYLWKQILSGLDKTLTANGGVFNLGHFSLNVPQGSTSQNIYLSVQPQPIQIFNNLASLGTSLKISATNSLGNLIDHLSKSYTLIADFSLIDLSRYKIETISFYSSSDGNNWIQEPTNVDLINKKASGQINHFSFFALMAQRADTTPPLTVSTLSGSVGQPNWYRSDVLLTLTATDNPGGLGVDYTLFKKDSDDWETYSSPLNITSEGHHKIDFYSADQDENIEDIKTVEFDVDKTSPEAKIYFDKNLGDLTVEAVDTNPGTVLVDTSQGDSNPSYLITDLAGNTLKMDLSDKNPVKKNMFKVSSLQYSGQTPLSLSSNLYLSVNDEQIFVQNSQALLRIIYNGRTNTSSIFAKEGESEKIREKDSGFKTLYLLTKQGNLEPFY